MDSLSQQEIKQQIRGMDPYQFEELVAEIWRLYGYQTTVRKSSGDKGIDIEASKGLPYNQLDLIQAKRYSKQNKVGAKKIRHYRTLYDQEPNADIVVLITTGYFTSQAKILADDLNVKLIDGDKLAEIIEKHIHNLDKFPSSKQQTLESNDTNEDSKESESPEPVDVDKGNKKLKKTEDSKDSKESESPDSVDIHKGDIVWTKTDQKKAKVLKERKSSNDYIVLVYKDEFNTKRTVKKDEIEKNKREL